MAVAWSHTPCQGPQLAPLVPFSWAVTPFLGSWWVETFFRPLSVHFCGLLPASPPSPLLHEYASLDLPIWSICPCHFPGWPPWGPPV